MAAVALVRYGAIPEVSRFDAGALQLSRGDAVLVDTHRGLQLGTVLNVVNSVAAPPLTSTVQAASEPTSSLPSVVRLAAEDDRFAETQRRQRAASEFATWTARIAQWELDLELIDLEWTADEGKLILYVLNHRGPDCTKLALQAAAAGLGVIEVQPVTAEGLAAVPATGGCGTCGSH